MNELKLKHYLLSFFLFFCVCHIQGQIRFSKRNFAYQYNEGTFVSCKYKLQEVSDSITVFLKLSFDKSDKKYRNWFKNEEVMMEFQVKNSYESKSILYSGTAVLKKIVVIENECILSFNIPKPNSSNAYLFLAYYESDEKEEIYIRDIPLKFFDKPLYCKYGLFDATGVVPVFENYVMRKDSVVIKASDRSKNFRIEFHKYNFPAALPPMSPTNTLDGSIKLTPDTVYIMRTDTLRAMPKRGNYIISEEGNLRSSLNFIVVDNRFPKVSKTKELVDPVIYIATDDERKTLRNQKKQKSKLDDFWLSLGQDKEFARKMIRNYYRKVSEANTLFTNYKEGWKTDMGMVYIIFGIPDEVYKSDVKETWRYKKRPNIPSLMFIFDKKINPVGDFYFELQNSQEYTNVWYNTIELWRKGILGQ